MSNENSNIRTADCCGLSNLQYIEVVPGLWSLCSWVAVAENGDQTEYKCTAVDAEYCHSCGTKLSEAPTRNYFPGLFEPLDDLIMEVGMYHALLDQAIKDARSAEQEG